MFARVQQEGFELNALYDELKQGAQSASPGNTGAMVTFTGLVRDFNQDGNIEGIELEHYPGMTENALLLLVEQATERFSLTNA
ncbi:molybdenum cofactor biosynthesis protein MoaE [Alteromonas gracilis]|uniref:molybdenum cofactor biosynthesis protein MoaE n=1 Tax=Alteromonas gracilis TaxID=1479524 RepID=UPI00321AFF32